MIDLNEISKKSTRPIASGSFGDVFEGKLGERKVAIKIFKQSCSDEKTREMFIEESTINNAMNHPNIVPFIGSSVSNDGTIAIISQWIPSGSLYDRIYNLSTNKSKPLTNAIKIQMFPSFFLFFLSFLFENEF